MAKKKSVTKGDKIVVWNKGKPKFKRSFHSFDLESGVLCDSVECPGTLNHWDYWKFIDSESNKEFKIEPIGNLPVYNFEQLQVTGWRCPFCNHYKTNAIKENSVVLCKMCGKEFFVKLPDKCIKF